MADIIFDPTGSVESFTENINSLSSKNHTVLILACDANGFKKDSIDPILAQSKSSVIGGIFPSIMYNTKKYDKGTLFIRLADNMDIHVIKDITHKDYLSLDKCMEEQLNGFDGFVKTMFVFFDGLAKNIGTCVNVLYDNYGLGINYIGGGSGSLSFEQKPSLFTNEGLLKDAFVYGYSKCYSSIGVCHGWKSIKGPYQVTKSKGTVIQEIDYKPAFDVYKDVIHEYSSKVINNENFFEIAKFFPFGINTMKDEKIVRDPIVLNGTDLVCVGEVEEGSYVDILYGKRDELIRAAKNAADFSYKKINFTSDFTLFIDCISRVLVLEEEFEKEIKAVYREGKELVGALTFGEIANSGRDYLSFYNKTSVVGNIGHG